MPCFVSIKPLHKENLISFLLRLIYLKAREVREMNYEGKWGKLYNVARKRKQLKKYSLISITSISSKQCISAAIS